MATIKITRKDIMMFHPCSGYHRDIRRAVPVKGLMITKKFCVDNADKLNWTWAAGRVFNEKIENSFWWNHNRIDNKYDRIYEKATRKRDMTAAQYKKFYAALHKERAICFYNAWVRLPNKHLEAKLAEQRNYYY